MSRPRVVLGWLVLLCVALSAFAGAIAAGDPCGEDECTPECGDCLACGQIAHLTSAGLPVALSAAPGEPSGAEQRPTVRPWRAVDHVPLSRA